MKINLKQSLIKQYLENPVSEDKIEVRSEFNNFITNKLIRIDQFAETNAEHYIVLLMATIVGDFMEEVIACKEIMSEN